MANDEWRTPPELFATLNADPLFGGFTLDVACTRENCLCPQGLYRDEGIDGLAERWSDYSTSGERVRAWMNPPYSRGNINRWVKKAADEAATGRVRVAGLVKVDPSTRWWQDHVMQASILLFCDRRVRFIDPDTSKPAGAPTFASCIAIWDAYIAQFTEGRPVCCMWGWMGRDDAPRSGATKEGLQ